MRTLLIISTLLAAACPLLAQGQSISLTRTPSGSIRVGETITVSLNVSPGAAPIRGGGAEIVFDPLDFEIVGGTTPGSIESAIARNASGNPYTSTDLPAWLSITGASAAIQVAIIPPVASLGNDFGYSGPVASMNLRAKRSRTGASVNLSNQSRLVPGTTTTTTGLTFDVEPEDSGLQILTSATSVEVPEGGTRSVTVTLSGPPAANRTVNVTRTAGDVDLTVQSGATLIFSSANWSTPQAVAFHAAADDDHSNGSATFDVSSPPLAAVSITASEIEIDTKYDAWLVR